MKKLILSLFVLVFLSVSLFAQKSNVTGQVVSKDDGLPLPGVTVKLKKGSAGTQTDANGKFSLAIETPATLIFSYIGYLEQEVSVPATRVINVSLVPDAKQLSEVIVSGVAGATTKEKMTVSVTKVSEERLKAVPAQSMSNALVGKVAGVRSSSASGSPGGGTDLQLRADNNLGVGSSPLILIDGVILSGSLSDINADDVESMEVIKGASASSLYGSRAGNGVISITTKRGKYQNINEVKVNVRNEVGFQQLSNVLTLATHHPFALATDFAQFKGQYTKYAGVTYPAGYTGAGYDPGIAGNRVQDPDHYADNEYGVVTDQQDQFFNTGTNYTNYVAVSTRSEKSNIYTSFENNSQQGIINFTDGYKRQNFRLNLDQEIAPWLKLSTSNLYINTTTNYPGSAGGIFFNIVLTDPDVNLLAKNPDGQPYYLRSSQWYGTTTNPLYNLYKQDREDKTSRWIGNYKANVKFTKWANFDISHSIEIQNYRYTAYNPKDTWTSTGGTAATFGQSYTNGSLNKYSDQSNTQNTQATLNLSQKFGDLVIRGKLSYLYEDRKFESNQTFAQQFEVADVPRFENFKTITNAYSFQSQEKAQNYFAILGLDFKDRYLFDGMFRYDGSSLFGSQSRWNPYYRVSGAYRISQDVKIKGIDELKIRAAHGTAGIRPGFSWQYETYSISNGATSPDQKGNEKLKPSKTTETEVGLNVDFLKKFSFEAVYAHSTTTDQFLNVPLIPFVNDGYRSQYRNAGSVESNTLEFSLAANWVKKKDFTWSSNIVFAKIRQKITELPIPAYLFGSTDGGGQQMFYVKEGEAYGAMYGYTWVKSLDQMSKQLPAGKTIADYALNSDGYVIAAGSEGKITEKAIKVLDANGNLLYGKIGDGNSDFNMGIANTFNYKGFSLYFLFDIKQGGDVYNAKGQWITRDFRSPLMDMSGVAADKKKAVDYFSNFYDVNTPNAFWVEDASYIKMRELSVGYSIPTKFLTSKFSNVVKGATLKVIGRNLFTISKYSGYDPEVGSLRNPYDGTSSYPNFTNLAFSLSLDF